MLSLDSIIRQNSGGVAAATSGAAVTVSLAGADVTEAGHTLVVFFACGNGQTVSHTAPPSGWLALTGRDTASDAGMSIFVRGPDQGLVAGESSWNFTPVEATAGPARWTVFELEGIGIGASLVGSGLIVDVGGTPNFAVTTTGTTARDTATVSSTYDGLAIGVHLSYNPSGTDTWGSHTDGFTEVVEGSQAGSGSDAVTLSVSALPVQQIDSFGVTATCSRTLNATNAGYAYVFVLTAEGARRAADLRLIDGAEHGLITGNTVTGVANNKLAESATAGVSISATAARSGGFGWLYSSTSAACNSIHYNGVQLLALGSEGAKPTFVLHFQFPTLPAADAEIWVLRDIGTAALITVRLINSSSKIGLKVGSGSEVVSDAVYTAGQFCRVDLRASLLTTAHAVDWQITYDANLTSPSAAVAQTQATATGTANPTLGSIRRGWTTSITATMYFDDFAASGNGAHYPIGDLRILPAKVDPAGTVVLSGTSTNFGVMTNDGSVTAWNATNARNAVDDIPPDLSGTRDAAVAVLAHASDYIEFPVETIDMAALGVYIRGVRAIVALWAGAATTATMRMSAYENGNLVAGISEQDPNASTSPTVVWVQWMCRPTNRIDWTQAKFDGLTLRFGSNDATPDIGIDAFVFEVAVVKAVPEVLFGSPGDSVYVGAQRDPDTNGLIGMDITTVGAGATINYEVNDVAQTPVVVAADTTVYEPIGAEDFPTVNRIELAPD